MNRYLNNIQSLLRRDFSLRAIVLAVVACITLMAATSVFALQESTFSASSRMASGKWVRVRVENTGMYLITDAQLKQMGFSDPSKVNVYGFGGRMLSENLTDGMPDDLPAAPSMRTSSGIVFFATDIFRWSGSPRMSHTINAYSLDSYYFLSDCPSPEKMESESRLPSDTQNATISFIHYQVHEQELNAPAENGRDIMGEELRSGQSRSFSFATPDMASDEVRVNFTFAANIKGGQSSVILSANGVQLPSGDTDKLDGVTSSAGFLTRRTTSKTFSHSSDKLDLGVKYSASGTFYGAWVDHIEVSYERELRLRDGQLHFFLNPVVETNVTLEGASAATKIWDVTDAMRPVQIDFELSGSTARFHATSGLREYVAFNPESIKDAPSDPEEMDNQNLHAMESAEFVIIAPKEYFDEAERLAEMHRRVDGMSVHVILPEKFYNEFASGMADPTAFRKAFKMWTDRSENGQGDRLRYVLLFSRPTFDNKMITPTVRQAGYPRIPQWQSEGIFSDETAYGTDDYIGMMEEGDNFRMSKAKVDLAVARWAVSSNEEARQMVDKTIRYVEEPDFGAWRNSVLLISDDGDNNIHMRQSDQARDNMMNYGNGADFIYERLYTDAFVRKASGTGLSYPDARERMQKRLSEGVGLIQYVGHANPRAWTHENLFVWNDITSMSNTRLPYLTAYCCEFMRWDANSVSGGEKMWLHPESGVIGMFCATRSVFMGPNGRLSTAFGKALYQKDTETGLTKRIGDVAVEAKNNADSYDDNKLRFALLGDPALKVLSPDMKVVLDRLGDATPSADSEELPELGAGATVSVAGSILEPDGTPASDFNGIIELSLYDAETPVTTNGWDSDEYSYNERTARLGNVRARVKDGKWEAMVHVPIEITNNYSPALLNFYAYSDAGREAGGSFTDFYVYGYDDRTADDTTGPEISRFVLNSDRFTNGSSVSTSPVVLADFSDPSGINVSDTGIGHKMTLTLDGRTYFDDINLYFSSDPDDSSKGSILYPLSDLEPGAHTLELTVWDNAGNSSRSTIDFQAAVGVNPTIYDVTTDCSPARTSVVFTVTTDRALSSLGCEMEVFDLSGRRVWNTNADGFTDSHSDIRIDWDLRDNSGVRVGRGIYLYRATIITPEGTRQTLTRKMAVAAAE
ncbi:MAG: type IX secretion system sortase PorU [Bacteroidales bacterium]|nr:type IX secretion system sortase PorU [Bacteroidales bacterium]